MSERLQKLLAAAGIGSRRQIENWIRLGRLSVDGRVVGLGDRADRTSDIRLDGAKVNLAAAVEREVLLYHKPAGEVTTRSDPAGRPTVFDRLPPPRAGRWVAVGRLDFNTSGLLLFTTDGQLAHRMMHPSSEIEREYRVRVRGKPETKVLEKLLHGVLLDDGPANFESVTMESSGVGHSWLRVSLREGRNREVRRMWAAVGFEVSKLVRIRYGEVLLPGDLSAGRHRLMNPQQASKL